LGTANIPSNSLSFEYQIGQLILWILCLISPIGSGQNDDRHGTFHLADDGELFLTQGVIIRETHSEGLEKISSAGSSFF